MKLVEVSRQELNRRNRSETPKQYSQRVKYQPTDYKGVNIREFFTHDRLVFTTQVRGDTDTYTVTVAFLGGLEEIINRLDVIPRLNLREVTTALTRAYANNDVFVRCSCDDFKYRRAYMATIDGYIYGDPEMRPNRFKRTNKELKGATCKHLAGLLSNQNWLIKVASAINNYIRLYPDQVFEFLGYSSKDELEDIINDNNTSNHQISMFDDQNDQDSNTPELNSSPNSDEPSDDIEDDDSSSLDYNTDESQDNIDNSEGEDDDGSGK